MAEGLRLKDQPASERPRERLAALGADALSHAELIAILLRTGLRGANAVAIVLAHNHPSGDPTPNEADIKVMRDIIRAGQLLKIDVLDHVIIGRPTAERAKDYSSFRELGYFYS